MVTCIPAKDTKEYVSALASEIRQHIIDNGRKVTFIDCKNRIDQYMFKRDEVERIMDNLFLCRMDRFFDFYERLEGIRDDPYFKKSQTLILSSWDDLMDDLDDDDKEHYRTCVREMLEAIERGGREVVVVGIPVQRKAKDTAVEVLSPFSQKALIH